MRETISGQGASVAQTDIVGNKPFNSSTRSGSINQSTPFHVLLYDSSHRQIENQINELLLINARRQFLIWDINRLGSDFDDFLTKLPSQHDPSAASLNSIASIWFLSGENMSDWLVQREAELNIIRNHLSTEAEIYVFAKEQPKVSKQITAHFGRSVFPDYRQPAKTKIEHVLFIDEALAGYQSIAHELISELDVEIVLLDPHQDGLEQIRQSLKAHEHLEAIHLLASGEPGKMKLGNSELSVDTLNEKNQTAVKAIRQALKNDGEIRIYGCRFNDGSEGLTATRLLSGMTGSFVIVDHRSPSPKNWEQPLPSADETTDHLPILESPQWNSLLPAFQFENSDQEDQTLNDSAPSLQLQNRAMTKSHSPLPCGPINEQTTSLWEDHDRHFGLDWSQIIAGLLVGVAIGVAGFWGMSSWGWF